MAIIHNIQRIRADLYDNSEIVVRAKQYDKASRYLNITCTNNGQTIRVSPDEYVAYSKIETPTYRALHTKETINPDGTITVALTDNALNSPGKGKIDVNLYSQNEESLISTMSITLVIQGSVYNDEVEINTDEFSALTDLIAEVTFKEKAYEKAENGRVAAENTRVSNENTRKSNETTRTNNENTRKTNENTRKTNETARVNAETARVSAENSRVNAEKARVTAESNRVSEFNTMMNNAETKIAEAEKVNIKSVVGTDSYKYSITNRAGQSSTSPNLLNKIGIGTVSTLASTANATASLTGSFGAQKLNLGIPVGKTPQIKIGTVTSATKPSVTVSGTAEQPTLNFVIPSEAVNSYMTTTEFEALFK